MGEENEEQTLVDEIGDFLSDTVPAGFEEFDDGIKDESFERPAKEEEEEEEEKIGEEEETSTEEKAEKEKVSTEEEEEETSEEKEKETPEKKDEVTEKKKDVEEKVEDKKEKKDEVDPALKAMQDQNALLLTRIEELSGKEPKKVEEPPAKKEEDNKPDTFAAAEVYDFVGEKDLDTILASKEEFNKFLSGIVNSTMNTTIENVYRNLPQVVSSQVTQQTSLKTYVDEFYKENADLLSVRKTVSAVANEVAAEQPDYGIEQIFKETEIRTRKMLGLKKVALEEDLEQKPFVKPPGRKPALPGKSGSRSGSSGKQLTTQQKHIGDVL